MPTDPTVYQRWWPLHLRVARGEPLAADDQAFYDQVVQDLDREEAIAGPGGDVRKARAAVSALEAERGRLEARRQQLDAEIARLETLLLQAGQPLDLKG